MEKGWVRLHRKFKDHWLWKEKRRFSRWEAWEDLFTEANYKENKVLKGSSLITIKRGQLLTSQIKLAGRWGWHRETVSKFLKLLKSDRMIDFTTVIGYDIGHTLVTILNYKELQNNDEKGSDITSSIDNRHYPGITTNNNKKDKNDKEDKCSFDFEQLWGKYPRKLGKKDALKHFKASIKSEEDWKNINKALNNYLNSKNVREGNIQYIQHGSTWFNNNWKDWIDYKELGTLSTRRQL